VRRTITKIGVGAAGGTAIGAIAGAGAIYGQHERHTGH
jgi:hypothetical protein